MLLRRTLTALALLVLGVTAGFASESLAMRASKPEVKKQIVTTIDGQLAAFRRKDYVKAYAFSAAALQAEKPLRLFVAIVKANYPEIWNNTRAEYGIVRDDGSTATVLVHVFAPGADTSYDYTLTKEHGAWRIHDVLRHEPVKEEKV